MISRPLIFLALLSACLCSCATQSPVARQDLDEGIRLYNQGNYNAAVKKITSSNEIWSASVSVQTEALKYLAFSYCVTKKELQCRQEFEKALKLDSKFDLVANEKGHPIWGPVFAKAKGRL